VTYTPVVADAGKWLIVDVTPASYDTVVGTVVSDTSDAAVTDAITVTLRVTESVIVGIAISDNPRNSECVHHRL
jgi:hypothetical protein